MLYIVSESLSSTGISINLERNLAKTFKMRKNNHGV